MSIPVECVAFDYVVEDGEYKPVPWHQKQPPFVVPLSEFVVRADPVIDVAALLAERDKQAARIAELEKENRRLGWVIRNAAISAGLPPDADPAAELEREIQALRKYNSVLTEVGERLAEKAAKWDAHEAAQKTVTHYPVSGVTVYGLPPLPHGSHEWMVDKPASSGLLTEADQDRKWRGAE